MNIGEILKINQDENYMLFNTIYHRNAINPEDGSKTDKIDLVLRNIDTDEKILIEDYNPIMEIYMAKPDVALGDYIHIDIDKKDTIMCDVKYKDLLLEMACLMGKEEFYWKCLRERRFDDLDQIKQSNQFFSSDRNIEDFYRYKCLKYFGMKDIGLFSRGFLDIEADIKKGKINFKDGTGTAPINMISLTYMTPSMEKPIVFTSVLRDPENEQIGQLENDIDNAIERCNELNIEEGYGDYEYRVFFCDNEVEVIKTIFDLINKLKIDIVEIWNMGFDIRYIMHRLSVFSVDPADIICHKDFNDKVCYYYVDKKNYEIKKKTDYFKCSSYTLYIDQMINYAAIRKGRAQLDSYKLDYIGELEVGMKKLDYSDTASLRELPYINFEMFFRYNQIDTINQYLIDNKTNDTNTFMYRAYSSATRYDKIFKEITFLTNIAFYEFEGDEDDPVILGNNVNALLFNKEQDEDEDVNEVFDEDSDDEEESTKSTSKKKKKFQGAVVGDMTLIMHEGKVIIGKRKSNSIFEFVVDYDYTSLYPTIIRLLNVYLNTLIGQIRFEEGEILPETESEKRLSNKDGYNRGAQYVEDLETDEPIFICNRWTGLPSFEEVASIIDEKLSHEEKYIKIRVNKIKKKKRRIIKVRKIK